MARLTREAVLTIKDIVQDDVEVPEWGGSVRVQSLSVAQSQEVYEKARIPESTELDRKKTAVYTFIFGVIDPVFQESDYDALKDKSALAMARVIARISELSGTKPESVAKAAETFREESGEGVPVPASA